MDIVAVIAFQQTPLPAGVTYGSTKADLVDSTGAVVTTQPVFPSVGSVTFTGVGPGDYVVNVQSLDSAGAALGALASAKVTVPVPAPTTFPEPTSVTVTLQ